MAVQLTTVKHWVKEVDCHEEWLRCEAADDRVTRIYCALCKRHMERLHGLRNFSSAFIEGILH